MYIVPGCKRVRVSRGNPGYIVSSLPPFCLSAEDVPPFPSSDAGTARREKLSGTPFAPAGSCIPCCRKSKVFPTAGNNDILELGYLVQDFLFDLTESVFSVFREYLGGWSGGSVLRYTSLNHKTGEPGFGTMPFPRSSFRLPCNRLR